jgi:3-oxoadipate enol-lactonase
VGEPVGPPVELFVRDEGSGPILLLLHGLGGEHTVWNGVVPHLVNDHRLVFPDLRGHGRTVAPPGSTFSFAEMERDVDEMLTRLGTGPVHVVGLSAGGLLALRLALDQPKLLRSLVVIGAAAHIDAHTRAVAERWVETYQQEGYEGYLLRLLKDLYYPDWIEAHLDVADRLREQQDRLDPTGASQWGRTMASFDLRGRLGKLQLKTLVVHGVDDQVVDSAHARLLRVAIPGAEMKLFPQTGHLVPVERPEETGRLLREWVTKVESTPAPTGTSR